MTTELRKSGLKWINDFPWGTHFCQFYSRRQDLLDILVPYFKAGLKNNEFCMWVTAEPLNVEDANAAMKKAIPDFDAYLRKSQIEIIPHTQWYLKGGKFNQQRVLNGWLDKLSRAESKGFAGLRLTGNTFWLEKKDWKEFADYEETINHCLAKYKILAICTYSLEKCGAAEIVDVVNNHQFALIKQSGRWTKLENSTHKQSDEALRASEEKFHALYSSMVEGVALHEIVYNKEGRAVDYIIIDVNPSYEKITGFSRDRAIGKRASALYGTGKPPYIDIYARVAATNKAEHFEVFFPPMAKYFSISAFSFVKGKFAAVFQDITERKRTEEALRQSQQRMNRSQEIAHLGSWELDLVNNRLIWSDEVYRIFGLQPQEFDATYEAFLKAVHPDDRQAVNSAYSNSLREGRDTYEIEHRVVRKSNGEVRIVHEKCQHIRDDTGKIIRSVGMVHDITERRQSDEKIKHLASFPQFNPNPVIELSRAGRIIFSNLAAIKVLERLNAAKKINLFLPDDFAQILKALNYAKIKEFVREVRIKDHFFIETLSVIPELNVVRIYAQDITARKLTEEQLQKTQGGLELKVAQRTEELVEANKQLNQQIVERQTVERRIRLSNAILKLFGKTSCRNEYLEKVVKLIRSLSRCRCAGIRVLDEEGNIPYESYIGFSREFWEAENWLSVVSDQCACIRVMTQRPEPEDRKVMTKSGSLRLDNSLNFVTGLTEKGKEKFRGTCVKNGFLSIAVIPIRYKGKVIAGIHLADEKEKMFSLELVESVESLTDLIGEGVHKFTLLEKIKKSNELLERAKRLSDIGSLAATVAHELRNPLGVIRTAAYNIKRKARNPLLEGHLANIEKKILEADQIINNLLFYSRLKAPHIEKTRLFNILRDCIEAVKNKYTKCAITIAKSIGSIKDDFLEADPLQLVELFDNILGNAYDAFVESRGKIEVAARKDNLGNIIVQVKDYGIGMDNEQLKRIFEPFYTTKAKGTGLGLTVCKQIVTLHNGAIEIESEKGKGTTVAVTLPLKRANAPTNLNS